MSASPVAGMDLNLRTDNFKRNAQDAKQSLQQLGTQGKQSLEGMRPAADSAAQGVRNVGEQSKLAKMSVSQLTLSMTAMTTSMVGVAFAAQNLSKAQLDVQRKTLDIERAQVAYSMAQANVNRMIEDGKKGTAEYNNAVANMIVYEKDLNLKKQESKIAQDQLNQSYFMFATSTVTTVVSAIGTVIAAKAAMTASAVTATGAQAGLSASLLATAASVKALTISMLTSPLAPYAIAAIGVGAAFIAVNEDVLGVRTQLSKLTGVEIPKFIGGSDESKKALDETNASLVTQQSELQNTGAAYGEFNAAVQSSNERVAGFGETIDLASGKLASFQDLLKKNDEKLNREFTSSLIFIGGLAAAADAIAAAEASQDPWERLRKYSEAYEKLRAARDAPASVASSIGGYSIVNGKALALDAIGKISVTAMRTIYGPKPNNTPLGGQVNPLTYAYYSAGGLFGGVTGTGLATAYENAGLSSARYANAHSLGFGSIGGSGAIISARGSNRSSHWRYMFELEQMKQAGINASRQSEFDLLAARARALGIPVPNISAPIYNVDLFTNALGQVRVGNTWRPAHTQAEYDATVARFSAQLAAFRLSVQYGALGGQARANGIAKQSGIPLSKLLTMTSNPDSLIDVLGQYRFYEREQLASVTG